MDPILILSCLKDLPGCTGISETSLVGGGAALFLLIVLIAAAVAMFSAGRTPFRTAPAAAPLAAAEDDQPDPLAPLRSPLDGPARPDDPEWIEAAILDAKTRPGVYTSRQAQGWAAGKAVRADWKRLNQVLGTSTGDNTAAWWGGSLGLGAIIAGLLPAAFGAPAVWYAASYSLIMPIAAFVGYNRWMHAIYQETYLPASVRLRQRPYRRDQEMDVIVVWVRRLGLARRPELLEGNQGQSGFRSKRAWVKMQAPVGLGLADFLHGSDFYDMSPDDSCIAPDVATSCYALDVIARRGGAAHAAAIDPPAQRDWVREVRRWLPWLLPLAVMGLGVVILVMGGDPPSPETAR